jgi:hypothetical protein
MVYSLDFPINDCHFGYKPKFLKKNTSVKIELISTWSCHF